MGTSSGLGEGYPGMYSLQCALPSSHQFLVTQHLTSLGPGALLCSPALTSCPDCRVTFCSGEELEEHRAGRRHLRNREMQQEQELKQMPHPLGLEVTLAEQGEGVTQGPMGRVEVVVEQGREKRFRLQLSNWREAEVEQGLQGVVVRKVAVLSWGEAVVSAPPSPPVHEGDGEGQGGALGGGLGQQGQQGGQEGGHCSCYLR